MDKDEISAIVLSIVTPLSDSIKSLATSLERKIDDLESKIDRMYSVFSEEMLIRDEKISVLTEKVHTLQETIEKEKKYHSTEIQSLKERISKLETTRNMNKPEEKKELADLVIVGDSMIKHIDVNKVNPGGFNELFLIPGGKINDIHREIRDISKKFDLSELLISAGCNEIPQHPKNDWWPDEVLQKITHLLRSVKMNMPVGTQIYYSALLPKWDDSYLPGILYINSNLVSLQKEIGFKLIRNYQFWEQGFESMKSELYSKSDYVHLNHKGVARLGVNYMFRHD